MAPALTVGNTHYLDDLVEDMLSTYHNIFPDNAIKPKMHFILHYGQQIRYSGVPCVKMTSRLESKHGYFKEICNRTKNNRNITKTMAERHQFYMYLFYKEKFFFGDSEIITSGSHELPVSLLGATIKSALLPQLHGKNFVSLIQLKSMEQPMILTVFIPVYLNCLKGK